MVYRSSKRLTHVHSDRELALRVGGLGSNPVSYNFYFLLYYYTWNTNRPSRRVGLWASAEFLVIY